jgi:non-heme chloroperoxidase
MWLIFLLLILGVGIHLLARNKVKEMNATPDKFPYERISVEPKGEDTFVTTADGTRLRTVKSGSGQPVLFVHGYGAGLVEWNVIWDELVAKGYQCISFDLRGHNNSTIGSDGIGSKPMAQDIQTLIDHFKLKDVILVGHSTGGFLSIVYQLNHTEHAKQHLKGLVLMASTAGDILKENAQNSIQIPLIKSGFMTIIAKSPTYGMLFGSTILGDVKYPAMARVFADYFARQNHIPLIPILSALNNESYYSRLNEIAVLTVVLCGEGDKTTPRWHSESMNKNIPNVRLVMIKQAGHMLNWETPDEIVKAIESLK